MMRTMLQLRTEEENKLSQILSQQRRYQQQLQQQQQHPSQNQPHHHHQHHHNIQSISSQTASPKAGDSQNLSQTEDNTTERDSTIYTSHSVDSNTEHPSRRHVWANPADLSVLSQSSTDRQAVHANDLTLQDFVNDSDARSSVSLLESESIYLPFNVPASPVVIRRPFTAPERQSQPSAKPSAAAAATKPLNSNSNLPRPQTAFDPRQQNESKYDSLEQRPIRPLNQHLAKGSLKPNFDVAPPLSSNSEPSVSTHKDNTLPTARSQDYESSSEQTASESENISNRQKKSHTAQPSSNTEADSDPKSAPKDKLNHIKSVAGSKRAGHAGVRERTTAAARIRGTAVIMKTSSISSTTTTATTASTMAASALMRARLMKANPSSAGGGSGDRNITADSDICTNTHNSDYSKDSPKAGKTAIHFGAGDSKQIKGKLNLERMELRKDGSSMGSTRDSGFLSRPASDAVMDETQQLDNKAATAIQSFWRGYWTREHNTKVVSVRKEIRARRAEDHIMLLRKDLERNRKLYEEEKRLRILQMEAIRLLYHEVQVLKSQSLTSSKELGSTDGRSSNTNTTANFSPMTTSTSTVSAASATGYSELNRTQDLERTCASLQSQVSQLQEALESVSSAVFRTNSLDGANFDLTDHSDNVQVTPYSDGHFRETHLSDEASHWGCIPHSLSPYPSEEEELYFQQVPTPGAPTPPRHLQLQHHSRTALLLSWHPSSFSGQEWEEEEGNRHIIGYRVYVNDQLKAFICQRTSVLVEGLNPSTTYKFYVKALSGFGESFESNIIMAKLAVGPERHKYMASSGSDSSPDSDKDVDSTENSDKLRRKNRKLRKSPRSLEKKKGSKTTQHHREQQHRHSPALQEKISTSVNSNNSAIDNSPFAILTHPKLHTHRRNRSRDLQSEEPKDSPSETTSKESSPSPGTAIKVGDKKSEEQHSSQQPGAGHPNPTLKREGSRKLPESPVKGLKREDPASGSELRNKPPQVAFSSAKTSEHGEAIETVGNISAKRESPSRKKESPPSGSGRQQSPSSHRRREEAFGSSASKSSPHVSPSCGSDGDSRRKISPQAGTENPSVKLSPLLSGEGHGGSQSSSLSETFTVDKANSFLESVTAITESALGGKGMGQGGSHGSPSSGSRGHRRTRSKDYQQQAEKGNVEITGKGTTEQEQEVLSVEEATRLGIGRNMEKGSGGGSSSARGHRRKRSKDLNIQVSEWKKDEEGEDRKEEGSRSEDQVVTRRDNSGYSKTEDDSAPLSSLPEARDGGSQSSVPVLDGRRRHSSGSRPNSPVVTVGTGAIEERSRMSIAEIMMEQKAKNLNKSSSLNSLSGRSEDGGSRSEMSKKSPSIESLPSSTRGETSKRTISNESLLSGGSSRGESSKRTHSSESLMSIRTDTSKRSHSNESLPGSARTESSRRSPSNESLPESIREEIEVDAEDQQTDRRSHEQSSATHSLTTGCRRTQSMGSARDIGRKSGSGDSSQSRSRKETTSSMVSKLLLKLESITRNNSTAVKEKKESLIKRSNPDDKDGDVSGSKLPSDDERRSGRRSRNLSESDAEGGASDAGSQLPPRAPSDSSSGSHSDDNRHSRRSHRRTPSDHRPQPSLPPETDPLRPTHSPIIMEGGMMKKSSSNVRRNQSFHGLLPSKHQDTKTSPSSNEDISSKPDEQTTAQTQSDTPTRPRSHLRSRTPSPARGRQPVLSAASQMRRQAESGKSSQDGRPST